MPRLAALPLSLMLAALHASLQAAEPVTPSLHIDGGVYRMFTVGEQPVLVISGAAGTALDLSSTDLTGTATGWSHKITLDGTPQRLTLPNGPGYQRISARLAGSPISKPVAEIDLGIVPVQPPGVRQDSFIASNTSVVRVGDELKLLNKLGIKVQRGHFNGDGSTKPVSDGGPAPLDFTRSEKAWAEAKAADSWILPLSGYALTGDSRTEQAKALKMHGPPRDNAEFCATWEQTLKRHPEFNTIEFWNEPWIFGWTWADTPAAYRALQRDWCTMARRTDPRLRIIAGNSSMFVEDHVEPFPESWKGLLDGTTHHPYVAGGWAYFRGGSQGRSMDHGALVTRRMGLRYYYLTEGGSEFRDPLALGDERNNPQNAFKVVQYTVKAALVGCHQTNLQWDIGYGPVWTLGNTTLAVLHSLIEDRPCVAEIWPHHELLVGAIFANPRHVDAAVKALPRASELSSRWDVPVPAERANDATKVAVVYGNTGTANDHIDTTGVLTISDASGLSAIDAGGRPIAATNGKLVLPLSQWAVYISSDTLSVIALRERIATATISKVTAVNLSACSLEQPADQAQTLRVRLENQLNIRVSGTLEAAPLAGGTARSVPFIAEPGALIEVAVPWVGVPLTVDNQYGVALTATTPAGNVRREQVLAVARFVQRSITADGNLKDWGDSVPVLLDSDRLAGGVDLSRYLLNPNLAKPTGTPEAKRVVARLYSAWDDTNVAIAVAVDEDQLTNSAGSAWVRDGVSLPYPHGTPGGLDHIRYTGDALMLTFGFRDRVPGQGRQMGDPWAWKGYFCDSDYHYVANVNHDNQPELTRLWGPDTPRRNGYQTVAESWMTAIPGAVIAITRDAAAKRTIYEMTIPRSELKLFNPAAPRLRFSFNVINNEAINGSPILRWAEVAGVFDHWWNMGSFQPTWEENLPCQTFFGISH